MESKKYNDINQLNSIDCSRLDQWEGCLFDAEFATLNPIPVYTLQ